MDWDVLNPALNGALSKQSSSPPIDVVLEYEDIQSFQLPLVSNSYLETHVCVLINISKNGVELLVIQSRTLWLWREG